MERIELYYKLASLVGDICTTLFNAYCLVMWVRPFMVERRKAKYVGWVYAAGMFVMGLPLFYISTMLAYGSVTAAAFLVMWWLDREHTAQKLFLAVTFFCVRWQAWRIVTCISNEIYYLTVSIQMPVNNMLWFRIYVAMRACTVALGCALMCGGVRCLLWSYGNRREHMNIREFLLLVMPSVSGVFAYGVFRYYNYIYERDSGKSPFELYGSYDLIILLYTVASFVTIFVMTYVFRQWKNEQEEDKQKEVLVRQMEDMENHIAEAQRLCRDMRMLRHDMGRHLMMLEQLYGKGAYEEAEAYARTLKQEAQVAASEITSGNPVTDVILSGRKKEMEEKGILFDCDFHYPQKGELDAFDVSIILNNALSNAIEAAERERAMPAARGQDTDRDNGEGFPKDGDFKNVTIVSLTSRIMKNMYMIEVRNSYRGELQIDEANGLPRTTKSGDSHGFGLANIRHVARKYFGDIEIGKEAYEGRECCVLRVMLQLAVQDPDANRARECMLC